MTLVLTPWLGARFGPRAIRAASARQNAYRGYNHRAHFNPYRAGLSVIDCGDLPVSPDDQILALSQMTEAFLDLSEHSRPGRRQIPYLIALGGDESIALPALRALSVIYKEPISFLRLSAHFEVGRTRTGYFKSTLKPGETTRQSTFSMAISEGLVANTSSTYIGVRNCQHDGDDADAMSQPEPMCISAQDFDELSTDGIAEQIMDRIGTQRPVYLSVDVSVLDIGVASGTGSPEPGGLTMRETIGIVRGLEALNIVGAEVVEVAPAYDGTGEQTALSAAQFVFEIVTSMAKKMTGKTAQPKEPKYKDEL
jgi:agmatinase